MKIEFINDSAFCEIWEALGDDTITTEAPGITMHHGHHPVLGEVALVSNSLSDESMILITAAPATAQATLNDNHDRLTGLSNDLTKLVKRVTRLEAAA